MRLTRNMEWAVIAILIALIVFVPLKSVFSSPIGKVVGLGLAVYAWKTVSPIVSLLLVVLVLVNMGSISEHLDVAPTQCKCKNPDFSPDKNNTGCFNADGKEDKSDGAMFCQCPNGYAWDIIGKQCNPTQTNQSKPIAAIGSSAVLPAETTSSSSAAPATSTGATTSPNMPQTTGSAAAQTMQSSSPKTSTTSGGVQPASGSSSTTATV